MSTDSSTNPNALPYLVFGGVELNGAQVWTYIHAGLAGDARLITGDTPDAVLFLDPTTGLPRTFISPAVDPAPWYDATYPESADFLGIWIENIAGLGSMINRSMDTRLAGLGGGVLGPLRVTERKLTITGMAFAKSQAGMEYGERWLTWVLQGDLATPCTPVDVDLRVAAPPTGMPTDTGRWEARSVGILTGPNFQAPPLEGAPDKIRPVTFTIAAEYPHLFKPIAALVAPTVLLPTIPPCTPICDWAQGYHEVSTSFTCGSKIGENCAVITIEAGAVQAGARIVGHTGATPFGFYQASDATVLFDIAIPVIPGGGEIVYDASVKQITFTDVLGNVYDGTRYIKLPEGQALEWPTARHGTTVYLDVIFPTSQLNTTTSAQVQTVYRVL